MLWSKLSNNQAQIVRKSVYNPKVQCTATLRHRSHSTWKSHLPQFASLRSPTQGCTAAGQVWQARLPPPPTGLWLSALGLPGLCPATSRRECTCPQRHPRQSSRRIAPTAQQQRTMFTHCLGGACKCHVLKRGTSSRLSTWLTASVAQLPARQQHLLWFAEHLPSSGPQAAASKPDRSAFAGCTGTRLECRRGLEPE